MKENEFETFFAQWNAALQGAEPRQVTSLYAEDAVLLSTLSNRVRCNHEAIEDYFVHFLQKGPRGIIEEAHVRLFGELLLSSGIYRFEFKNRESLRARFTFVCKKKGEKWLIVEHHSSLMPEPE